MGIANDMMEAVHEAQENTLAAIAQRDALADALRLVQAGLRNKSIKAKHVIEFNSGSCDIRSVEEIVDAALAKLT